MSSTFYSSISEPMAHYLLDFYGLWIFGTHLRIDIYHISAAVLCVRPGDKVVNKTDCSLHSSLHWLGDKGCPHVVATMMLLNVWHCAEFNTNISMIQNWHCCKTVPKRVLKIFFIYHECSLIHFKLVFLGQIYLRNLIISDKIPMWNASQAFVLVYVLL